MRVNLLALIGRDTVLRRTAATRGGEYSGACPLCRRGRDRFKVWPREERWACLGPDAGRSGCDLHGDGIEYLRQRDGVSFREACERLKIDLTTETRRLHGVHREERGKRNPLSLSADWAQPLRLCGENPLTPPNPTWQAHGRGWAARWEVALWRQEGARAREYLRRRGLSEEVLRRFGVGYNARDVSEDHEQWGLARPAGGARKVWVPRGITLPWVANGALWRINVRRPQTPSQLAAGQAKYIGPAGFGNALYNADSLDPHKPAVLVEGEIDALTIVQACGESVAVVATGSTAGARRPEWVMRLRQGPCVLLAFDQDENGAGDKAAAWWLGMLPNARRWAPLGHDANSLPGVEDVRRWIGCGLAASGPAHHGLFRKGAQHG